MKELLLTLLEEAINECYIKDKYLIDLEMEQASVARIFYYMQSLIENKNEFADLRKYNVDCEYYKHGKYKKSTPIYKNGVRPDVVLHKRGVDNDNLLIIEFKSNSNNDHISDYKKLKEFTNDDGGYHYYLGIFVKLNEGKAEYVYFQDGKQVKKTELK